MPDDLKPVLARQMEVYAGFLEHTDHHVGRLLDALEDLGVLDDTLVYYIIGDNGASAEGTLNGTFNELLIAQRRRRVRDRRVRWPRTSTSSARPTAYNHYAVGWAHAMDTPVPVDQAGRLALGRHPQRHDRALAQRLRGQGRGPQPVPPRDRRRRRPCSTPPGIPAPDFVNGIQQMPLHGVSMRYAFDDADAAETPRAAVLRDVLQPRRSTTRAGPRSPATAPRGCSAPSCPRFDDDVWELYDTTTTGPRPTTSRPSTPTSWPSCSGCSSSRRVEVQRAAARRPPGRALQLRPRRPARRSCKGNTQLLFGGMGRLSENSVLNLKNKSHSVTAEIDVPDGGANGVIIAQGGAFAGWCALPASTASPRTATTCSACTRFKIAADTAVPAGHAPGAHGVRLRRRRARQGRRRHPLRRRRPRSARAASTPPCR